MQNITLPPNSKACGQLTLNCPRRGRGLRAHKANLSFLLLKENIHPVKAANSLAAVRAARGWLPLGHRVVGYGGVLAIPYWPPPPQTLHDPFTPAVLDYFILISTSSGP
jgi:hypothetical protein